MMSGRRGIEAGIDPAEDDPEIGFQDVGNPAANGGRDFGL
jgi:hypothetical protein